MSDASPAASAATPPAPSPTNGRARLVLAFGATGCALLLYVVWSLLWHMTDDAYITYRYVHNLLAGDGLVWNAAPFARVDGNTDFLWSLLLALVWSTTGIEPPTAAPWLSLGFGAGIVAIVGVLAHRLVLPAWSPVAKAGLCVLVLFGTVTHRGLVAYFSSGLGAAFFLLLWFLWALVATSPHTRTRRGGPFALALLGALCAMARPEGQLIAAATLALLAAWRLGGALRTGPWLAASVALLLPVMAHAVWHRLYYGDWLPNTYYAKRSPLRPDSGWRYAASYAFEFGVGVWLPVALLWLVRRSQHVGALLRCPHALGWAAVTGTLLVHFTYYTLVIGGDLFEYRVYAQLFPFLLLAMAAMLAQLGCGPRGVRRGVLLFVVAGLPIGWWKYACLDGPIAPSAPAWLRPLVQPYDDWQDWLRHRTTGMRNHEMRTNLAVFEQAAPNRARGSQIPRDGNPVLWGEAVGVVGWVLPHVAIVDAFGLSDRVIAHTEPPSRDERLAQRAANWRSLHALFDQDHDGFVAASELVPLAAALAPASAGDPAAMQAQAQRMLADYDHDHDGRIALAELLAQPSVHGDPKLAHDRFPPPGYREGLRDNVTVHQGQVFVTPRPVPLTDDDIRAHEAKFWAAVQAAGP